MVAIGKDAMAQKNKLNRQIAAFKRLQADDARRKVTAYTTVNSDESSRCPRDRKRYEVLLFGKIDNRIIQFDPKWGKTGGWFDNNNKAVAEKDIFQWRPYSG